LSNILSETDVWDKESEASLARRLFAGRESVTRFESTLSELGREDAATRVDAAVVRDGDSGFQPSRHMRHMRHLGTS